MKKAIKLTLAVALVMGATSLFAQQKFGRINTQEIIVGMPETKDDAGPTWRPTPRSCRTIIGVDDRRIQHRNCRSSRRTSTPFQRCRSRQLKEKESAGRADPAPRRVRGAQHSRTIQKRQNELLGPDHREGQGRRSTRWRPQAAILVSIRHLDGLAGLFRRGVPHRHRPRR